MRASARAKFLAQGPQSQHPHPHPLRVLDPLAIQSPSQGWPNPAAKALHILAESGRPAHILIHLSLIPVTQCHWENEMTSWLQKHFGRLNVSRRCRGGNVTGSIIQRDWRGRGRELKINFTCFLQSRPFPHQLLASKWQPHDMLCPLVFQGTVPTIRRPASLWTP